MNIKKYLSVITTSLLVNTVFPVWSETAELYDKSKLRVCADPSNLPFSNQKEEGFENKIANLLAQKLGVKVDYTWYPQSVGFARNTLFAGKCDLVIGVAIPSSFMQVSNPYYHSSYVMVYNKDSKIQPKSINAQLPKDIKIGVIESSPGVDLLVSNGLEAGMHSYPLVVDTRFTASGKDMIKDLVDNNIDIALLWGPIAGYFAKSYPGKFVIVPLDSQVEKSKLDFQIGMGMRFNEPGLKNEINDLIKNNQSEINSILKDYGVPLV